MTLAMPGSSAAALSMLSHGDIKRDAAEFVENVASRLAQFQRFLAPGSDANITNRFLEAQVRSLIEDRVAPKRILSAILRVPGAPMPETGPVFVDGVIHDPQRGPVTFESEFKGNLNEAVWLPNEVTAKAWMEYVKTGAVSDTTAPPSPYDVKVTSNGNHGMDIRWSANADFESGIRCFIVTQYVG